MRTLAIGDIHGCYTSLTSLLSRVAPSTDDQIIFLGDYIDRGADSRGVIELLASDSIKGRKVFLRGNHEVMMLDARANPIDSHNWLGCGGFETLLSYGVKVTADWASAVPETHWQFLEKTSPWFETEKNIYVHGGADPDLDMSAQRALYLYWSRFEQIRPHKSGKKIICGHSPQMVGVPEVSLSAICVDTGAVFEGWLSCLDVGSGEYWQANEEGSTREGRLAGTEERLS
ncbi:MAG TPA: metallophosphoesterase family protein [Candidatus Saccharimonadales bacterium]|nr:metallophosphoesterase family protein [Candidatus Saccharimonadales bacterium]